MDHPLKKGANVGVVAEDGQGAVGCIISEPEIEDGKYSYNISYAKQSYHNACYILQ